MHATPDGSGASVDLIDQIRRDHRERAAKADAARGPQAVLPPLKQVPLVEPKAVARPVAAPAAAPAPARPRPQAPGLAARRAVGVDLRAPLLTLGHSIGRVDRALTAWTGTAAEALRATAARSMAGHRAAPAPAAVAEPEAPAPAAPRDVAEVTAPPADLPRLPSAEEKLERDQLARRVAAWGSDHPDVALIMHVVATRCHARGARDEAHQLYERALNIQERAFGPASPAVAAILRDLADLERELGREDDACTREERLAQIMATWLPEHGSTTAS